MSTGLQILIREGKSLLELFYKRINMSVMYKIDCNLGRFVKRPHYSLFSKALNKELLIPGKKLLRL